MIELKIGCKYLDRLGGIIEIVRMNTNEHRHTHPFWGSNSFSYRYDGSWSLVRDKQSDLDLVSEYPPPFSIAAGNYYRTRDGRKAYVACGPVATPLGKERDNEELLYGFIDEPSRFKCEWWEPSGASDSKCHPLHADDLVALWHPETLTDPVTGKKYRVAEEVT